MSVLDIYKSHVTLSSMLYLIGWGANDLTVAGKDVASSCAHVYLENYTGKAEIALLEEQIGKKVIALEREDVEQKPEIFLEQSKEEEVAIIFTGDPLVATTHTDLLLRAKKEGIETKVIPNASVLTLVAASGLQLYKFGKTASIPRPTEEYHPETPYDILKQNQSIDAHTLFLLDTNNHLTVKEAIEYLLKIEEKRKQKLFTPDTLCIGCARLGTDTLIKPGKVTDLMKQDFGPPPHCLIVPSKLHFMEEEFLA